jgi:hypothetical protein
MPALRESLPPDALAGWEAGALMNEFTLLFMEGREAAANAVAQQLRDKLGDELASRIFGN